MPKPDEAPRDAPVAGLAQCERAEFRAAAASSTPHGSSSEVATRSSACSAASSRQSLRARVSAVLPVLIVLCDCTLTAETTFKAGDGFPGARAAHIRLCPGFAVLPAVGAGRRVSAAASDSKFGTAGVLRAPSLGLKLGTSRSSSSDPRSWSAGRFQLATQNDAPDEAQRARDDFVGDAVSYSAQERRMLSVLSKVGRLHKPTAPMGGASGDSRNAEGGAGQASREQKEEMAKDRRDEKVALRRGEGAGRLGAPFTLCCTFGAS